MNYNKEIYEFVKECMKKDMKKCDIAKLGEHNFNVKKYVIYNTYNNILLERKFKQQDKIIEEVDQAIKNKQDKLITIKKMSKKYNMSIYELSNIWTQLRVNEYEEATNRYRELEGDGRKYLSIKFLNVDNSVEEEIKVIERELEELKQGIKKNDRYNILEEYFDVKQAMDNTLYLLGFKKRDIAKHEPIHYDKLIRRGWKIK